MADTIPVPNTIPIPDKHGHVVQAVLWNLAVGDVLKEANKANVIAVGRPDEFPPEDFNDYDRSPDNEPTA